MNSFEIIDRQETGYDSESFTRVMTYTVQRDYHTYTIPKVDVYMFGTLTEEDERDRIISVLLKRSEKLDKIKKLLGYPSSFLFFL